MKQGVTNVVDMSKKETLSFEKFQKQMDGIQKEFDKTGFVMLRTGDGRISYMRDITYDKNEPLEKSPSRAKMKEDILNAVAKKFDEVMRQIDEKGLKPKSMTASVVLVPFDAKGNPL